MTSILKNKLQTNVRMKEKRYKLLYISTIIDDETNHRTIQYYVTRSKTGQTLKQILKRKTFRLEKEIMEEILSMKPFENVPNE